MPVSAHSRRKGKIKWKSIPGFSAYLISEYGDVKRVTKAKTRGEPGYILSGDKNKYPRVKLMKDDGGKACVPIHVLVCFSFHGNKPSKKHQAAHKDDNKLNNHISNLYWATPKQNRLDATRNGKLNVSGSGNPRSILTEKMVLNLRKRFASGSCTISQLSRDKLVSHSTIRSALYGITWPYLPFACAMIGQGKGKKLQA